MERVTGIGGIVLSAKDPRALQAWYRQHLGIDVQDWGGTAFSGTDADGIATGTVTAWSIVAANDDSFRPGTASFMVNYRVADLRSLLHALKAEGCQVSDGTADSDYGRFGWVVDPEGNKVELWEPAAAQ